MVEPTALHVSYLDNSSLPPSPLENLYQRTASFSNSRSLSTSPAQQESPGTSTVNHQNGRGYYFSGSDGGRRQSLSGPLPAPDEQSALESYRRPSLSGPLPFSSQNPYGPSSAFDNLSPWREFSPASSNGGSPNPFVNPFSPSGSISSLSPSSLPRPPSHHSNGNDSPSLANHSNVSNGYHSDMSPRGPPVRQLYGYSNGAADPFASQVGSSLPPSPSPSSPSTGEQWASFPPGSNNNSPRTSNGKPLGNALSQRTHGRSPGVHSNGGSGGGGENGGVVTKGIPNLSRSRSIHNGAFQNSNGGGKGSGVLPFNTRGTLNRSMSCNGADDLARKFSKGRGGLGEGVLETLVAQLVFAKEKPSMLADMIFCPSKLSSSTTFNYSKGPFAYARDLVERILLAQVHALTPLFKNVAQKSGEFEEATWVLSASKNGEDQEPVPNDGYRLLRLQTQFVEAGLETFDMLCNVRKQFPSLLTATANDQRGGAGAGGNGGVTNAGLLRIGCFGGGPGCEALAIRLFFMRLLPPQVQMQVDIFDRRERWKEIVENISLKGVGLLTVDLFDVVVHPTGLRQYRVLVFIESLGRVMKSHGNAWKSHNWAEFWSTLFRNTSPGVLVIIHETSCPWEEMKPKAGSNWWCSALAEQELVHIVRKM
ncbi:unnamed protein product [Calypogeia fissa]